MDLEKPNNKHRGASHLRLVSSGGDDVTEYPAAPPANQRPKTIGRLIAQTALIADSAKALQRYATTQKKTSNGTDFDRRRRSRRFGWLG